MTSSCHIFLQQPSVSLQMVNFHTQVDQILIRIWRTDRGVDQEPEIATDAGEGVTALSTSKMSWLLVSEDGDVRLYDASHSDLQGIVTNMAGVGVRSVAVNPKGKCVTITLKYICPKMLPLETTLAVLNNLLRFHYIQEMPDKFPGQLSEERKKALDGYTHRGAHTPCDIRSDFLIASTPHSGKRSRISRTSS